jgi:hypothetical protein
MAASSYQQTNVSEYWSAVKHTLAQFAGVVDGYGARFHHGFCCVRVSIIWLRLLFGARFSLEFCTRGCHFEPFSA